MGRRPRRCRPRDRARAQHRQAEQHRPGGELPPTASGLRTTASSGGRIHGASATGRASEEIAPSVVRCAVTACRAGPPECGTAQPTATRHPHESVNARHSGRHHHGAASANPPSRVGIRSGSAKGPLREQVAVGLVLQLAQGMISDHICSERSRKPEVGRQVMLRVRDRAPEDWMKASRQQCPPSDQGTRGRASIGGGMAGRVLSGTLAVLDPAHPSAETACASGISDPG